jgi:hypothetical protein
MAPVVMGWDGEPTKPAKRAHLHIFSLPNRLFCASKSSTPNQNSQNNASIERLGKITGDQGSMIIVGC